MRILILALMLLGTNALAGTIDPRVPDQKHKDYGAKFKNVVRIKGVCGKEDKKHNFLASAVIIRPNWALTAAHVIKDTSDVEIVVEEKKFPVVTIAHKDFEEDNFGNYDIALCHSEEDFKMDFYPELYSDKNEEGKVVSIAGYGITGTFSSGAVRGDGIKRAGSNIVSRLERSIMVCVLNDKRTELEFLIASGDSGGGLFIENKLAGINSFVMTEDGKPNGDYGDESGHTRISLFYDWIDEKINEFEK